MNNSIELSLSIDEVNGIMQALGQMPYTQVAGLIDKIRGQATPQVQAQSASEAPEAAAS